MAAPLSKAPPPPLTPAQLALRRKQKRLVIGTLYGILLVTVTWEGFEYGRSTPLRAEAKVQAGLANLSPGHYAQSIPLFDEALEIQPGYGRALYYRGVAKQNLGHWDEALADYGQALQAMPNAMEVLTASASVYVQKGQYREAIEQFTKILALQPNVDARYQRGTSYAILGQHEAAIKDFTWVIEEQRDAPYSYFARARSRRALGDLEGAAADEAMANSFDRTHQ